MPKYDGFPVDELVEELYFEAAVYTLLMHIPESLTSRLIYYRPPEKLGEMGDGRPESILGRRLMLFEMANGRNNVWYDLDRNQKVSCCSPILHYKLHAIPQRS